MMDSKNPITNSAKIAISMGFVTIGIVLAVILLSLIFHH